MACFLVPAGEAIVTTIAQKVAEKKEKKDDGEQKATGMKWSRRLSWLNKMLWGGSALLALEHIWHGEIIARPPFLTAMQNPADTAAMLQEMATVGAVMAAAVTIIWGIIVVVVEIKSKAAPRVETIPAGGVE